jgi:hypothetical protein
MLVSQPNWPQSWLPSQPHNTNARHGGQALGAACIKMLDRQSIN